MGPEDPQEEGQEQEKESENVVRLPRDWIGPREELVPFGPGGRGVDGETLDGHGDDEAPIDSNATRASAPSAEDFWGEHSDALQDVLQGPPQDAERSRARTNRSAGTAALLRRSPRRDVAAVSALVAIAALFIALSVDGLIAGGNGGARPEDRVSNSLLGRVAAQLESPQLMPRVAIVAQPLRVRVGRARASGSRDLAQAVPSRAPRAAAASGSAVEVSRSGSTTESSANSSSEPGKVSYTPSLPASVTSTSAPVTSDRRAAPVTSAPAPASAASGGGSGSGSAAGPTGQGAIVGPASCNC